MSPPTKAENNLRSNSARDTGSAGAVAAEGVPAEAATIGTLNSTVSAGVVEALGTSSPANRFGHPDSPGVTVLRMRRNPFCGSSHSVLTDTAATPPAASKGYTSNPETPESGFHEISNFRGAAPSEVSQVAVIGTSATGRGTRCLAA